MTRKALTILAMLVVLLGAGDVQARSEEAIKRNNFGADFLKQGRLDEAIAEFQRSVEVDPEYAAAHFNLAYAYDQRQRFDEAIAQYKKALQLEPNNLFGLNNLGVLYDKNGLYDEAIGVSSRPSRLTRPTPRYRRIWRTPGGTRKSCGNVRPGSPMRASRSRLNPRIPVLLTTWRVCMPPST